MSECATCILYVIGWVLLIFIPYKYYDGSGHDIQTNTSETENDNEKRNKYYMGLCYHIRNTNEMSRKCLKKRTMLY